MHSTMSPPAPDCPPLHLTYRTCALPQPSYRNCDSPGSCTGQTISEPSKRTRGRSRAACTRSRIAADDSPRWFTAQLLIIHSWHFNMDVDPAKNMRDFPVEQGAGNPFLVFGHSRMGAGAGFLRIAVISTRSRVHRRDELKVRGKSQ